MRFTTLAWFYNAEDTLLHIRYLLSDQTTPNRFNNEFFGGTPIESFQYNLKSETQTRYRISECIDFHGQKIRHEIPYQHKQLLCSAQIDMDINFHLTELWWFLTNGVPLSKIVVRHYHLLIAALICIIMTAIVLPATNVARPSNQHPRCLKMLAIAKSWLKMRP